MSDILLIILIVILVLAAVNVMDLAATVRLINIGRDISDAIEEQTYSSNKLLSQLLVTLTADTDHELQPVDELVSLTMPESVQRQVHQWLASQGYNMDQQQGHEEAPSVARNFLVSHGR